jgi:hypothetical protein
MLYIAILGLLVAQHGELARYGLHSEGLPSHTLCGLSLGLIGTNTALGELPGTAVLLTYQHVPGGTCMMLNQHRNFCHEKAPSSL